MHMDFSVVCYLVGRKVVRKISFSYCIYSMLGREMKESNTGYHKGQGLSWKKSLK